MDDDILLGSKRITASNLLQPDVSRLSAKDEVVWISYFSGQKLDDAVPEPVQRLFEFARGAMIYGWLYYPLLTIGYIECTKVLEAAARHAAAEAGIAKPVAEQRATYEEILERLHAKGLIDASELERWSIGRKIRNMFAHPTQPTILLPSYAGGQLRVTAEQINRLVGAVRSLA